MAFRAFSRGSYQALSYRWYGRWEDADFEVASYTSYHPKNGVFSDRLSGAKWQGSHQAGSGTEQADLARERKELCENIGSSARSWPASM